MIQASEVQPAQVDYCGETRVVQPGERLSIGREADLVIDSNQFLHRVFLVISDQGGYWFLHNVGNQLGATVTDLDGRMEAFVAPGASIPLVFGTTVVVFTAGPTTYELIVKTESSYVPPPFESVSSGATTAGQVRFTRDQQLLILALAEPRLRRDGRVAINLPSSPQAAARLGWTTTKFNRKLDNVCDKLTKLGVRGLQGDVASYASNRRARLVEYSVATRLVTAEDLFILDRHLAEIDPV